MIIQFNLLFQHTYLYVFISNKLLIINDLLIVIVN